CTNNKLIDKKGNPTEPFVWEIYNEKLKRWYELHDQAIPWTDGRLVRLEMAMDTTDRKHLEEEIKHQLTDKEIILKEAHHRIKNNFASIVSLLSLQVNSISNPEAISALQDAIGRVSSMQILYEKLLLTDNYNVTSIKQYLENLIDEIISLFPDNINISLKKQIDDFELDSKRLVPIGIIINELLTNTMKYGFPEKNSGLLHITVVKNNGNVTLSIQDDGIGLPDGFNIKKQKGFGLMLVKILSQQLKGNFTIENNNGTKSTLEFSI
ncbi:MAG: ATP-binding protein, partial [Spirochaetales bacterium]|nr:ATP-binding protein [Spirochaetales bacterium]